MNRNGIANSPNTPKTTMYHRIRKIQTNGSEIHPRIFLTIDPDAQLRILLVAPTNDIGAA
jgi:hypothetical protein